MYKAKVVAGYIISYSHDKNYKIDNLILQKLLYYVQAVFLVEKGCRCFKEPIIAWAFGPVVVDVYKAYREYGRDNIEAPINEKEVVFNEKTMKIEYKDKVDKIDGSDMKLIQKVVDSYGCVKNPFELVRKTHNEEPWKKTSLNNEITCNLIQDYYSTYPDKLYYKRN